MMSSTPSQQLERALESLHEHVGTAPKIGIVLGSGLGEFADTLSERQTLPYATIEGMVPATIEGHAGNLVLGSHGPLSVAALQGRVHLYEGHDAARVVFGVRLLVALGAKILILTNAAGGIADRLRPGSLMLIEDQLNLTGENPLRGPHDAKLGARFPDMSCIYDTGLRDLALRRGTEIGIALEQGVYAGVLGPNYETPAEIRMLRQAGADAVGMSTVLEAIAAHHMGARCLGLSCITNRAAGRRAAPLSHDEVQRTASRVTGRFITLLDRVLAALAEEGT